MLLHHIEFNECATLQLYKKVSQGSAATDLR